MNINLEEYLVNLYIKSEIEHKELSDVDKNVIYKAMLSTLINTDIKYEIYLDKMKEEAFRVIKLFQEWYNNPSNSFSSKEYECFYNNNMKNTFVYDVYKIIYIFFNPIVMNENFITDETEKETNVSKRKICNDEFIIDIFHSYFYYNMSNYDNFKKQEIDWSAKYLVPTNFELKKQIYTQYDIHINNYVSRFKLDKYELNQAKNDPRWLG